MMDHLNAAAPGDSATGSILRALLVGATLGMAEAVWVLNIIPSVTATEMALLLLYGCGGAGLTAALAAAAWRAVGPRQTEAMTEAIAIAVTVVGSIHLISALVRLRQPQLAWLIPGCIGSAAVVGIAARWLARRVALLRNERTWLAVNMALAAIACMPMAVTAMRRAEAVPASVGTTAPNVLLISVDTLRPDRLGCYGSVLARTPHIDAFAQQGALFEQAATAVPLTGPSHTTMLTGLYHNHHGAQSNGVPIGKDVPTVADILSRQGYRTAAFVSGWTLKNEAVGLATRFERYDENFSPYPWLPDVALNLTLPRLVADTASFAGHKVERVDRPGATTTTRALQWLAQSRDRPFLVFAHFFDPHAPYAPPAPYDEMYDPDYSGAHPKFNYFVGEAEWTRLISSPRDVAHYKALYAGEVSYVDGEVGRLLDGLAALGLADNTLVIFASDHGESLTEHDFYFDHGELLYDTCLHVPLIMRFPDRRYAGTRYAGQVRLADITPTILDVVGVRALQPLDGRSVLAVLDGSEPPGERPSFGWLPRSETHEEMHRSRYAVRDHGYKLIWNYDSRQEQPAYEELYNLHADPSEEHNVIVAAPEVLGPLRQELSAWRESKAPTSQNTAPSQDVKERLRALGY